MKIPRREESEGTIINMSSLLDVLFILIIFFLATATFKQEERDIQVNLPQADAQAALTAAPKVIVINVRRGGEYVVGTRRMDLSRVRETLRDAVSTDEGQKVLVRGDRQALHGHVAAAVRVCREAGVKQANIGYDAKPGS